MGEGEGGDVGEEGEAREGGAYGVEDEEGAEDGVELGDLALDAGGDGDLEGADG